MPASDRPETRNCERFRLALELLIDLAMKRLVGAFSVLMAACGVGDPNDGGAAPVDMNPLGRQCTALLTTQGTFAPDTANPRPAEREGCWPFGVWTFTAKVESNDCAPAPQTLPQYQFSVDYALNEDMDPIQKYRYVTDPTVKNVVKVSQAGNGICEGELSLFSTDGKSVFLFKPYVAGADNIIKGDGEFGVFDTDQYPL